MKSKEKTLGDKKLDKKLSALVLELPGPKPMSSPMEKETIVNVNISQTPPSIDPMLMMLAMKMKHEEKDTEEEELEDSEDYFSSQSDKLIKSSKSSSC